MKTAKTRKKRHSLTPDEQRRCVELYQSGLPAITVARALNVSPHPVARALLAAGVPKHPKPTLEERFRAKVKQVEGDGCWEWQAARIGPYGYGAFGVGGTDVEAAHRVAWRLAYGDPVELWVLHKCDNPPCVRPDHLYLGTHEDNCRDMLSRRRQAVGERHGMSKLTAEDVMDIRERYKAGESLQSISDRYEIDYSHISQVARGVKWAWLPGAAERRCG